MRLTIDQSAGCADAPVALLNADTGAVLGFHESLRDAALHRALLENFGDVGGDDGDDDGADDDGAEYCPLCGDAHFSPDNEDFCGGGAGDADGGGFRAAPVAFSTPYATIPD